jgi:hypothetical protein
MLSQTYDSVNVLRGCVRTTLAFLGEPLLYLTIYCEGLVGDENIPQSRDPESVILADLVVVAKQIAELFFL